MTSLGTAKFFEGDEGGITDLEQAVGEKCRAVLGPHKTVVSASEIERILETVVAPSDTTPATATVLRNALASLQRAMQYNPRFLEASVISADLYERLGDVGNAYNALVNLVPRMPDEPALHNRILDLLLNADRDQATTYLQQVIASFPDVPDSVYSLAARLFDTDVAVRLVADGEKRYDKSACSPMPEATSSSVKPDTPMPSPRTNKPSSATRNCNAPGCHSREP
ncbi:MAG: hypothetical protein HC933_12760 [Pleurocapsa sp. SU_196_0]|nr:hypothetical protein [Pleurocapsa sp. SU_196_0]